jgi:transcriptional regulator
MYRPNWVRPDTDAAWIELVERHPFGTLVSVGSDGPEATHIPFLFDEQRRLVGHVARGNRHWRALERDPRVLLLFQGPSAYVSPAWYRDEPDDVPTWNYAAAHLRGRCRIVDDVRRDEILRATVHRFAKDGWQLDSVTPATLDGFARGVTAFEIDIESVEVAWKLSQDKPERDRARVAAALDGGSPEEAAVAAWMRRDKSRRS